jgi:acyl-CoA synthetase (AMP-forming)/AMP-acid ligase II
LDRCKIVFPNARLFTVYGSTEAEPISKVEYSALSESDKQLIAKGCGLPVGKPVDGIDVRILPVEMSEKNVGLNRRFAAFQHICDAADVPLNRLGEIIVTGNHVVKGYYHGLGDSSSKLSIDGKKWHRTGDIGYFDNHDRLWLIGRNQKESNLDTTFSYAVEAAALSHPSIKRAAFVARAQSAFLFIETQMRKPASEESISLLDSISWAEVTTLRRTNRIPFDTRHNTKVLYNQLPT